MSQPIDPSRCPLCGQPNACALVEDGTAAGCWCAAESFDAALLARVPAESAARACICLRCQRAATGGG